LAGQASAVNDLSIKYKYLCFELIVNRVLHDRMAFFGLPERELPIGSLSDHHEKIAEYTWGEDGYDGLGDALQEARDDLNDETFGSTGPVGT
jgi:hypothetical protein